MDTIKQLVNSKSLKTTYWKKFADGSKSPFFYHYNKSIDAFTIKITESPDKTIVHYIDEHVGLLYRVADFEIIGIRIEDFETAFLPKYAEIQKAWKLSDNCEDLQDFGDLIISVNKQQSYLARKITDVTIPMFEKAGLTLTPVR